MAYRVVEYIVIGCRVNGVWLCKIATSGRGNNFKYYLPPTDKPLVLWLPVRYPMAPSILLNRPCWRSSREHVIFHVASLLANMITLLTNCNNESEFGLYTSKQISFRDIRMELQQSLCAFAQHDMGGAAVTQAMEVVSNSGWTPNGWPRSFCRTWKTPTHMPH